MLLLHTHPNAASDSCWCWFGFFRLLPVLLTTVSADAATYFCSWYCCVLLPSLLLLALTSLLLLFLLTPAAKDAINVYDWCWVFFPAADAARYSCCWCCYSLLLLMLRFTPSYDESYFCCWCCSFLQPVLLTPAADAGTKVCYWCLFLCFLYWNLLLLHEVLLLQRLIHTFAADTAYSTIWSCSRCRFLLLHAAYTVTYSSCPPSPPL